VGWGISKEDILSSIIVLEPATEQVLATLPEAGILEVDAVVQKAKRAFPKWRAVAPADRANLLRKLGDAIDSKLEFLANLEARNAGKPIGGARWEIGAVAQVFRYYAGAVERHTGQTIPVAGGVGMTFLEPIGVVGMITPWNYPLFLASWKIAPALAAGNCCVLKPAELTPLTAIELEKIALEVGFPEGVLNVVVGLGYVAGRALVDHPDVAKIAFTGSTAVGRDIATRAAANIKRVTLELGGKSACIVFSDADIEKAANSIPGAVFDNAGQDCCCRSRLLVQKNVLEKFLGHLETAMKSWKTGDPFADGMDMGPVISSKQRDRVTELVNSSSVLLQGSVPTGAGFWFPPTVLGPVAPTDRVAQEEIFGPVTAIMTFETEAEAIELANSTIYGLSGSIWTQDGAKAFRVARAVESGVLSINSNSSVRYTAPFGGMKQSGYGRELGPNALEAYSEVKMVYFSTDD
jgi:acyl-CoA reductase-like NAD-dependent aldehyde dehydrogenase